MVCVCVLPTFSCKWDRNYKIAWKQRFKNYKHLNKPVFKIKYFYFYFLCLLSNNKYINYFQKQAPRGVPRKRCSVNLLHILRTPFLKNTSGWLLLYFLKTLLSFFMMFFSQFAHVFSIFTRFTLARREFLTHSYWEMKNLQKVTHLKLTFVTRK